MTITTLRDLGFVAAAGGYTPTDAAAAAYIAAVEAADGQALEAGVRQAIDAFVIGCKADGIWSAIKASCILAGARTLSGALMPLVGTAPTNVGPFVAGDYNRKTGLVGNGSTKYLNSNRAENADPINSVHASVFVSNAFNAGTYIIFGTDNANATGLFIRQNGTIAACMRSTTSYGSTTQAIGFAGANRSGSATSALRAFSQITNSSAQSNGSNSTNYWLFSSPPAPGTLAGNGRLAFYSIGESLDLALLDTRVTALINAFAAAIP